ncbi:hypothetical protein A0H81_02761 [Grifola frondosa]|uniref:Uncharacterized protein n=1 Tax=Grifola frondosa TaxID=5627 RepID=A0A1C7MKN6_GRIFR|nr:hypothetical protein A0H81_02761 [Grifola frondosa]
MSSHSNNLPTRNSKRRRANGIQQEETTFVAQGTTRDTVEGAEEKISGDERDPQQQSAITTEDANPVDYDAVRDIMNGLERQPDGVPSASAASIIGAPVEYQARGEHRIPDDDDDHSVTIDTPQSVPEATPTADEYADMPALIPIGNDDDDDDDDDDGPPPLEPAADPAPLDLEEIINPGYLPDAFVRRLAGFVDFVDIAGLRFSVTKVPPTSTWGLPTPDDKELTKFLCYEEKPVSIWLVGRVRKLWFYNLGGEPHDKVNIGIRPLREIDCLAADRLLNTRCRPIESTSYNPLYAGKLMLTRTKGDTALTPALFTRVYDALNHYGPKSTMKKISPAVLGEHDIVLVECFLTRWKTGERAKRTKGWSTWRCGFELNSISLLFSAPDTSTDVELDLDLETALM